MTKKKEKKEINICLEKCDAACCKNLAMDILKPKDNWDIEDLRWKLHFKHVKVYIVNKRWHLLFETKCRYLLKNNRCSIYERRPEVCREHSHLECGEREGNWYDILISTPEELDEYFRKEKRKKKKKK